MTRRHMLALAGAAAASRPPVIDTHIHLFDPTRPQGVPWPSKSDAALYRPALPERLRAIAAPLGVAGAIEVECSPWLEDNQWVLELARGDTFLLGMVGNLEPGKPEFRAQLDRFHRDPLFLGIRYGNLWGRNLATELRNPEFVAGLRALAAAGLALDTANPNAELLGAVLRATDRVPDLRVVIDHLPRLAPLPVGLLQDLAQRRNVFVKVSGVLRRVDGRVSLDPAFYRDTLDTIWGVFGEERVLYGSDWPNADRWGTYAEGFNVILGHVTPRGPAAAEKYFWKNSAVAYRWSPREGRQPRRGGFR